MVSILPIKEKNRNSANITQPGSLQLHDNRLLDDLEEGRSSNRKSADVDKELARKPFNGEPQD